MSGSAESAEATAVSSRRACRRRAQLELLFSVKNTQWRSDVSTIKINISTLKPRDNTSPELLQKQIEVPSTAIAIAPGWVGSGRILVGTHGSCGSAGQWGEDGPLLRGKRWMKPCFLFFNHGILWDFGGNYPILRKKLISNFFGGWIHVEWNSQCFLQMQPWLFDIGPLQFNWLWALMIFCWM